MRRLCIVTKKRIIKRKNSGTGTRKTIWSSRRLFHTPKNTSYKKWEILTRSYGIPGMFRRMSVTGAYYQMRKSCWRSSHPTTWNRFIELIWKILVKNWIEFVNLKAYTYTYKYIYNNITSNFILKYILSKFCTKIYNWFPQQ